jgi:tryptophan-rich sensory protein
MTTLDDVLARAESPRSWRSRLADVALGALPLATGALSAASSMDGLRVWYRTLDRPEWNPPDAIFGPVWTGLYTLMGISLVQVARATEPSSGTARRVGLGLFAVQLALNGAWSWIFFSQHAIGLALADILVLWVAIAATIGAFWRVRRSAAALLVPYLAWVTFATALTASIWLRNR